ncbi:MAG TPA: response regulator [Bryobacteraceae bacterium]|nr:response regulator [Bryobacteraceae bacterium]
MDWNDELVQEYLADSSGSLAALESDLLAIEKNGAIIDRGLLGRALLAAHTVKVGADFFELTKIRVLADQTEDALRYIRDGKMVPTPDRIRVMLAATDQLRQMVDHAETSNQVDITPSLAALNQVCGDRSDRTDSSREQSRKPHVLLAEDDPTNRFVLQTFLSRYGECHIAINGEEAVEAVRCALQQGLRYDLICMDILMPEMNGRDAVRKIRALEEAHGILSTSGAKIIMTTTVDDVKEVIRCFKELCDAYLVKPIDLAKLLACMKSFQLVQ